MRLKLPTPRLKRNIAIATFSGWYQQATGIIGSIISVPFIISHMGINAAGIWFSVLSILSIFQLLDFGFSSALSRQVAHTFNESSTSNHIQSALIKNKKGWIGVNEIYQFSQILQHKIGYCIITLTIFIVAAIQFKENFIPEIINNPESIILAGTTIYFSIATKFKQALYRRIGKNVLFKNN